jgi:hypothetical protein
LTLSAGMTACGVKRSVSGMKSVRKSGRSMQCRSGGGP